MPPLPRRILRKLLKDFGPKLLEDPTRIDALLADLWGQYRCERFLLFHAAKLLSKSRDSASYGHQIPQILQKKYGFSPEAAHWAAESWFAALDRSPPQPSTSRNGNHTGLSNAPQLALRRLLTDYGPALLEDPARVHALLADLSGSNYRERFLLVQALRARIPAELLVLHLDDTDQMQQLSHRFQTRYGLSTEAARWAVESWSLSLEAARSGQDPSLKEDREAAKAIARQLVKERDAARETARQKTIERAAAESVVRQKASDLAAAQDVVRRMVQVEEIARRKGEEVKKVIVQILEFNPLTPNEAGKIFGVSEEQAVTWLRQLQATGKIEEILLRRHQHYPAGFQVKGWSYTSVVATDKDKRAAGIAARQKVKEWRAAEAVARKPEKERASALSKTQKLAKERAAAESKSQQITKDCAAADSDAQRLAKKLAAATTTVQQLAKKEAEAGRAARLKSKEWSSAAATAHKMVNRRTDADALARQTEKRSIEIILQNLKQKSMTSREVATILETEQEQAIELLKRLLSENQIEITWSKPSPYAPCYKPVKHSSTPDGPRDQSAPRQSGCLWLLALPGLLGLLALLG